MKNNDENINIEKELFEFFDKLKENQEIPVSTKNAINNAFYKKNKTNLRLLIPKVLACIFSIIIISTGVVFANEIVYFIKFLFVNSTDSIDSAVNNGYVQNVSSDYIYDNDIGIKITNLMIDDTNLDISLTYKSEDLELQSIELYEYEIRDDNNNLIYKLNSNKKEVTEGSHLIKYNDSIKLNDNEFKESLLISSNNYSYYEKLIIKIDSIRIKKGEEYDILYGNWFLEQEIDSNILNRKSYTYEIDFDSDIDNYDIKITETSLKIEINFKNTINEELLKQKNNIVLVDKNGKSYDYTILKLTDNNLYLEYDIGLYYDNIDELELILKYNNNTNKKIIMKKRHS